MLRSGHPADLSVSSRRCGQLIASIVGTTLFPIIIIAVNALYLRRQGRLSTFAGEHCSAKVEHSHRSRWCRIVYHLTAMSSYEGYQFAVSLLGCLSFIGYRCGSPLVLRYRRSHLPCGGRADSVVCVLVAATA